MESGMGPGALVDRGELRRMLSRAVSAMGLYESDSLVTDLACLHDLGALFIGRAAYSWNVPEDEPVWLERIRAFAAAARVILPNEAVLQACVFEIIDRNVNRIPIPDWVFEDLGEEVEHRNFRLEDIVGRIPAPAQGLGGSPWRGGGVPDLTKPEARRWYYYRVRQFLEAGYEAIHLGQIHLVAGADQGYRHAEALLAKIRSAAARFGRRGWVLLDAHSHGIARGGRLLFDFVSRPISARALLDQPERVALVRRGSSLGGRHPGGWDCAESPTLVEIDNWGGYSLSPERAADWLDAKKRAASNRWGWDDIGWFAHQGCRERREFLRYAYAWTALQGPEWFFQAPFRRTLGAAGIELPNGSRVSLYRANDPDPEHHDRFGFGDAAALKACLEAEPFRGPPRIPGDSAARLTASGLEVPEPVALVGELQDQLGGIRGDASCPWSVLHPIGGGRFSNVFALPAPGRFSFTVMAGGTGMDPTNVGGLAGGPPYRLRVREGGSVVRFVFDWERRELEAMDLGTGESALERIEPPLPSAVVTGIVETGDDERAPHGWY